MRKHHHPFSPSFHNRMHSLYPISALGFNPAQRLQRFYFLPPFRLIVTMSLNSEGSRCNACNFWITCFKRSSLLAIAYFSPSRGAEMQVLVAYLDHVDKDNPQGMAEQQNRKYWALDDPVEQHIPLQACPPAQTFM